jgi:hypothetical protein
MYTANRHWEYHEVIDHESINTLSNAVKAASFIRGIVRAASDLPTNAKDGDTYLVLSDKVFYTFGSTDNVWLPQSKGGRPTSTGVVYDSSNTDHIQTVTEQYNNMQIVYTPTYDDNDYITSIQIDVKSADGGTLYSTTTLTVANNTDGNITSIS